MSQLRKRSFRLSVCIGIMAAALAAGTVLPAFAAETAEEEGTEQTQTESTDISYTDFVVCKVNGQEVMNSRFRESYYAYYKMFAAAGYDMTGEDLLSYIENKSYEETVENVLLQQGLEEDGYYADGRDDALERLHEDLMAGFEVTEDDIQNYYDNAVNQDEANYKNNVDLYKKAKEQPGLQIWYIPEGGEEDGTSGPVELTDEVKEKIAGILRDNALNEKMDAYIAEKSAKAVILNVADPDYDS